MVPSREKSSSYYYLVVGAILHHRRTTTLALSTRVNFAPSSYYYFGAILHHRRTTTSAQSALIANGNRNANDSHSAPCGAGGQNLVISNPPPYAKTV